MKDREQIKSKYKELQDKKKHYVDEIIKFSEADKNFAYTNGLNNLISSIDSQLAILDWVLETKITGIGSIM